MDHLLFINHPRNNWLRLLSWLIVLLSWIFWTYLFLQGNCRIWLTYVHCHVTGSFNFLSKKTRDHPLNFFNPDPQKDMDPALNEPGSETVFPCLKSWSEVNHLFQQSSLIMFKTYTIYFYSRLRRKRMRKRRIPGNNLIPWWRNLCKILRSSFYFN